MTQQVERMLPLYEAKMIHQFDHRWATYETDGTVRDVTLAEKQDPSCQAIPRYWVREEVVEDRLGERLRDDDEWLLGFRDICRSTDERTMIASQFPLAAVGHTLPIVVERQDATLLLGVWSSFVFDYVARQKVGGTHMTYGYLMQLATVLPNSVPPWLGATSEWLGSRVRFLQSPESWASVNRDVVRAELDACYFQMFGLSREEVDYVMETFPIVRRKDVDAYGSYRTKELILGFFDDMAQAICAERRYSSSIDESIESNSWAEES